MVHLSVATVPSYDQGSHGLTGDEVAPSPCVQWVSNNQRPLSQQHLRAGTITFGLCWMRGPFLLPH